MVDYNNFAKTFSNSRKNMKWEEIEYFLSFLSGNKNLTILDIGCGNGRFLGTLKKSPMIRGDLDGFKYLGVDLSMGLLEEAKKIHPEDNFLELDMLYLDKIKEKFSHIFFIASFHHLKSIDDRIDVLKKVYNLLEDGGKIFMTNWALNSSLNIERYKKNMIIGSENEFGGVDYNIKIGKFERFYHCFSIEELNFLFSKVGFRVIESSLFENNKNYVSIISR